MRMLTIYPWHTGKLRKPLRLIVVSDLHNEPYNDILPMLSGADALIVAGDTADRYRQRFETGVGFIREAAQRLPTFVGVGNHELRLRKLDDFSAAVAQTSAPLLMNDYIRFGELVIGCWYRPEAYGQVDKLPAMEAEEGIKILLCHRPEDYMRTLRQSRVDLVLAGHAHGGQIRIGQRGLFSPGQGPFPPYTRGLIDGRMLVSAGAGNPARAPRWGNPREVLCLMLD